MKNEFQRCSSIVIEMDYDLDSDGFVMLRFVKKVEPLVFNRDKRKQELSKLSSPQLKEILKKMGIELMPGIPKDGLISRILTEEQFSLVPPKEEVNRQYRQEIMWNPGNEEIKEILRNKTDQQVEDLARKFDKTLNTASLPILIRIIMSKKKAKTPVPPPPPVEKKVIIQDDEEEHAEDEDPNVEEEVHDPEFDTLPPLYSIAKTGKKKMWKIWYLNDVLYRQHGDVDGKKVTTDRRCESKNVGRANETSAEEQAALEAEREWIGQLDKGYKPDPSDKKGMEKYNKVMEAKRKQGNVNTGLVTAKGQKQKKAEKIENLKVEHVQNELLPMHADKFNSEDKNCMKHFDFKGGVLIQPKLDGWRMVARTQMTPRGLEVVLTTRNGKQYPWYTNIRTEVLKMLKDTEPGSVVLDGEVYAHDLVDEKGNRILENERFEIITSSAGLARKVPHPMEDQLKYYVFDAFLAKDVLKDKKERMQQVKRRELLDKICSAYQGSSIVCLSTYEIHSIAELKEKHKQFVSEGYEGTILRAKDLIYELKHRSKKMRKLKDFIDKECMITGAKEGKGTEEGCVVWECVFPGSNETFDVRPRGSFEERKVLWKKRDQFIGQMITVRYFEVTPKGVPRLGVGIGIRKEFKKSDDD